MEARAIVGWLLAGAAACGMFWYVGTLAGHRETWPKVAAIKPEPCSVACVWVCP